MKKFICVTLILCLGLAVFASCSSDNEDKKPAKNTQEETIEEKNPDTTIETSEEIISSEESLGESSAESSLPEGLITEEDALYAIKAYCYINNPDLEEIVNEGTYTVYWEIESSDIDQIVVLFRSYTGAQIRYYIDRATGSAYVTEFVSGITEEEEKTDEFLNIKDYLI